MVQDLDKKIQKLQSEFENNSLHHALIFQGAELGRIEDNALHLTRKVLSMNQDQKEHPDLFHLRPAGKMRIIGVEQTRNLISELNRTANQGDNKVALIHEAERMRKESSNAFLKTLEEPPPGTYIFLITTRNNSILPTIRSRCLQVRLSTEITSLNHPQWQDWLQLYESWISCLLDREKIKQDRVSPMFMAYGLIERLISINKQIADEEWKKNLIDLPTGIDEKEKDALETSIRKGIRSNLIRGIIDSSRSIVINSDIPTESLGGKLAKVVSLAEKISGLLEVNLKDETAFEYFWLSSLRIWTSKS